MSRVRYETYCDGRVLKVTEQINLSGITSAAKNGPAGGDYLDGQHWWVVDEQRVADDVAQAMLSAYQAWEQAVPAGGQRRSRPDGSYPDARA